MASVLCDNIETDLYECFFYQVEEVSMNWIGRQSVAELEVSLNWMKLRKHF